ncbi:MAG: Holliday junction branch migration protein RuvA [Candidatus Aminicenantes bacterium]|nr:Holliday junction branch migration protein RuvA [Candidatus Aminicenantes bacterium]MDH5383190.1 Holliday junction branch migration protein RuvA [Candidatus Aminicenantes bacterium]MDH5742690.1 Holliday junction branch migration protein RuvA [Candidatus Aminicenantes bacterium]
MSKKSKNPEDREQDKMIAYLKGSLIQKSSNQVILDIGGVGYSAWIPLSTYLKLGDLNQTAELYIYTHMTDNSLALYGFYSERERDLFLKLINISGIGPKIALNILSGIEASDLEDAIRRADVARISLIPGIGKKTAMRIALELQEKLDLKEKVLETSSSKEKEDLISALTNLGFKRREVEKIVDDCIQTYSLEAGLEKLLRESLKRLAKI